MFGLPFFIQVRAKKISIIKTICCGPFAWNLVSKFRTVHFFHPLHLKKIEELSVLISQEYGQYSKYIVYAVIIRFDYKTNTFNFLLIEIILNCTVTNWMYSSKVMGTAWSISISYQTRIHTYGLSIHFLIGALLSGRYYLWN